MKVSYLSICFLVPFLLATAAQIKGEERDYITWDDLTLDNQVTPRGRGEDRVIVVDQSGRGNSLTVQGAIDLVPQNNADRVKIHILPGVYREKVHVPASKPYISFIGNPNQPSATVITWGDKASDSDGNGGTLGTWNSASVTVESDFFVAVGITFQNTVVSVGQDGYQAVALRIAGDRAVFYRARFLGSQDTLLDEVGRHYFILCFIQGSIDFIFGDGRSLYKECTISVVGYAFAVAAQSRSSANDDTGFSFVNCRVVGTGAVFLGRAWGAYSRIIYADTEFDITLRPQGWNNWGDPSRQNTVVFGEYNCKGRGADREGRAGWSRALSYDDAKPYLDSKFIDGEQWLRLKR